jgi:serine protease Do
MRLSHKLGLAGVAIVAVLGFSWQASGIPAKHFDPPVAADKSSAHLKVVLPTGHGSAVHIGDGYLVTAGHVAEGQTVLELHSEGGTVYKADVLWINKEYDIAFLKMQEQTSLASAPLNCAPNAIGQKITAYGNPTVLEFIYTRGEVVGAVRQFGDWKAVVPVDLVVAPGMSGGAVLDDAGAVVGITVGVMQYGYGLVGIGLIVPSAVVCDLRGLA